MVLAHAGVSDSTVDNIRHRNGFDPAPFRGKKQQVAPISAGVGFFFLLTSS